MEYKSDSELAQQTLDRGDLIVDRTISLEYQPDGNRIRGLTILKTPDGSVSAAQEILSDYHAQLMIVL